MSRKIKIVTTDQKKELYWQEEVRDVQAMTDCMHVVNVFSELTEQEIEGFGAAFTEAAAHTYSLLPKEEQQKVMDAYFGADGLGYNLCRVSIHSCDFGLGNYTYIEEGDKELKTFSVARDEAEIFPMIDAAKSVSEEEIVFLASPWSPPAFMKTSNEMNNGGKLLEEYYEAWANYYVLFIKEYRKRGVDIQYITVQNEPMAVQTWDSCIYEAEVEGLFVAKYLGPILKANGLQDIQIFVWDHNKEEMYDRVKSTFKVEGCEEFVKGVAIHWYTGDHFDAIRATRRAFPDKKIFFTEGCVEYSRFTKGNEIFQAQMYAHDILGDLKAGCSAFIDWNMLLNKEGGPNHVGNFCAAPIMEAEDGSAVKNLSYYYIGHFSKYIQKGAKQCMTSTYTDQVETVAFINPDGSRVVVLLNKSETDVEVTLRESGEGASITVAKQSIVTCIF